MPTFSEAALGMARRKPCGFASILLGINRAMDFEKESNDPEFPRSCLRSQGSLGIKVPAEMPFSDLASYAGLFPGFAGGALTGGHAGTQPAFRKGPFPRAG